MSEKIYIVYECDKWKTAGSMRLLLATTSESKLISFVAKKINDDDFDYPVVEGLSKSEQAEKFSDDFYFHSVPYTNNGLEYGYIVETYNGEEM